ncbi:MAG TPA: hypothetical protein VIH18_15480 [Candidatus Binatia bacterium]
MGICTDSRNASLAMLQPEIRISSVAKLFGASGNLTDENTRQHLAKFLEALARWIALIKPKSNNSQATTWNHRFVDLSTTEVALTGFQFFR